MNYTIKHRVISSTCLPEETTGVPFFIPWYEEYDYSDRTSPLDLSPSGELHVATLPHMSTVTAEHLMPGLFPVAAKKKEEEEERARKEKAEKGVTLMNCVFLVVVVESLGSMKRLRADSVTMMSAGCEG